MILTQSNKAKIRWLTYLMFMMFAMTTDAVGVIIPEIMKQFDLSMTQGGLIHYGPMTAIALSGLLLGFLADRFGKKFAIALGLGSYAMVCFCFLVGSSFYFYLSLMVLSGFAIGIFKTAALASISDISSSNVEHTATVNGVEAFFAIGAILGPLIVAYLLSQGIAWHWLYLVAGSLCLMLLMIMLRTDYGHSMATESQEKIDLKQTLALMKNPYVIGFSLGAFLYVATESAIYVWMPTYLKDYSGPVLFQIGYALTLFFILRALGRFLGMWLIRKIAWSLLLALCSGLIALCFVLAIFVGKAVAVYSLPLSGLFMSIIYPTLNSKGISCFPKKQHGSVAGIILFFTALGAAFGPLVMGVISDAYGGDAVYGFIVATGFASLLFLGLLFNLFKAPVDKQLQRIETQEYLVPN